jgi:hypothetical protein
MMRKNLMGNPSGEICPRPKKESKEKEKERKARIVFVSGMFDVTHPCLGTAKVVVRVSFQKDRDSTTN